MTQDEIIEMARQAGFPVMGPARTAAAEAFAKLVAAKAVAKDRKEFDIDELCARQNKIGYKQGYNAGVKAEREACAKVCDDKHDTWRWDDEIDSASGPRDCATAIRARGEA
jgi:hypothetical protein